MLEQCCAVGVMKLCVIVFLAISWVSMGFDMKVSYLQDCRPGMAISAHATIKDNFIQNGYFNITIPLSDQTAELSVKYSMDNKTFLNVGSIKMKNICSAVNKYMGETWYDLQRQAHVNQIGKCPIEKDLYRYENYYLKMERMPMQTFPKGYILIKMKVWKKGTDVEVLCIDAHAYNK